MTNGELDALVARLRDLKEIRRDKTPLFVAIGLANESADAIMQLRSRVTEFEAGYTALLKGHNNDAKAYQTEITALRAELAAAQERSHHIETQATKIAIDKDKLAGDLAAAMELVRNMEECMSGNDPPAWPVDRIDALLRREET